MDLLRRIFDIPPYRNEDHRYKINPKDNPSGNYDSDNFSGYYGGGQHNGGSDDLFGDYHGINRTPNFPPPQHNMPTVFDQMDDMFRHLDAMMQGIHLGPGQGAGIPGAIITEIEDTPTDSDSNPRDAMLKNPDSSSQNTPTRTPTSPYHHSPEYVKPQYEGEDDHFGALGGFGKVLEPFRMMEDFIRIFEGTPAIPHLPDQDSTPAHPRESVVKKDTDLDDSANNSCQRPQAPPYHHAPGNVNPQYDSGDDFANFDAFGTFGGFGNAVDPFRMMEDFFRGFEGKPDVPHLPGLGPAPVHPRDSVVKKDTDLDDRAVMGLLDEGPKYEGTVQGGDGQSSAGTRQPGTAIQPIHPQIQTRFHSTSVIRVRKPDGSIKETRKYRDHTGREEITVQCKEADELTPGVLQPGNDMPSLFPKSFRWW